ncbi:PREDICTED: F-box/kelch-repeat protein At3g06240-like [Fragaria vesca subsp. vesca]
MSDVLSTRLQQRLVLSGTGPSSESPVLDLDAVIFDILSRLPPKSLLRFRCVCKAWRTLISDPYFIKEHLSRVNNSCSYSVFVKDVSTFRSIDSEALFRDDDGPVPSRELYFPVINGLKFDEIHIVGSCNGLICLRFKWCLPVIMLWNPCTRESKVLPKLHTKDLFPSSPDYYGFGYDSATDDYKVIVGDFRYLASYKNCILVYTVKTGSWRKLQYHGLALLGYGCLVNGALHWVQEEPWEAEVDSYKLVSFDLTEEKFHEIPSPYYPNNPIDRRNHLVASAGKFRNSLALYSRGPGSEYMMWVMKEAGVEKSWNEVIKIPKEVLHVSGDHHRHHIIWTPLCISNDGVTLIVVCAIPHHTVTYVETLVSPFARTGM